MNHQVILELGQLQEVLRAEVPGASLEELRRAAAVLGLVHHVVFEDRSFTSAEDRLLRQALERVEELSPAIIDALCAILDRAPQALPRPDPVICAGQLRGTSSPDTPLQLWDALLMLAAAGGSLRVLAPISWRLGADIPPEVRAAHLGLELPKETSTTSVHPDAITWDADGFRIGHGMNEVSVSWLRLRRLEPVEPWPRLAVRTSSLAFDFAPAREARDTGGRERFAERVASLLQAAGRYRAGTETIVHAGWVAVADVGWEAVGSLPEPEPTVAAGAYRTAARERITETIVARRGPLSAFETLLEWLASTPENPFRHQPREVVVTDSAVHVRRRDGRCARVPTGALRLRLGRRDGIYVFGRRTRLLLTQREVCPVAQHLDALLRTRGRLAD